MASLIIEVTEYLLCTLVDSSLFQSSTALSVIPISKDCSGTITDTNQTIFLIIFIGDSMYFSCLGFFPLIVTIANFLHLVTGKIILIPDELIPYNSLSLLHGCPAFQQPAKAIIRI
ncbi:hypothetical protein D3C81_1963600 [compost metagenome]